MVIRNPFTCITCNNRFILRIGIGHEPTQKHFFLCPFCEEECCISLDIDFQKPKASISHLENCSLINNIDVQQTMSWKVINLHPDYIVPFDERNKDGSFPWLADMFRFSEVLKKHHDSTSRIMDLYELLNFNSSFLKDWKTLIKAWNLLNNNKMSLSETILKDYDWIFSKPTYNLFDALIDFSKGMIFPSKMSLLKKYEDFVSELKTQNPDKLASFINYYKHNFLEENLERYRQIFKDYFRDFSEFKQTLNYVRCDIKLPNGSFASSSGFENVKMFYGNAFEAISSNFVVPACLNNIFNNRDFDRFQTMDLSKYLTIDKANRGNPFKDNDRINFLLNGIDTKIRNASHHGSIRLLKGRDKIEYRTGGTGAKREMTYAEYTYLCNTLITNLFTMMSIELQIAA